MQEEVKAAISIDSKTSAEQVCASSLLAPGSIVSTILENAPKCGTVERNEISADVICNADTAPKCSEDSSQCCILEETTAQVSIEQDLSFNAYGESYAIASVNDLATSSGTDSSQFVLLGAKESKSGGTMSTLGIFRSAGKPRPSDIVRFITQRSPGDMLGGIALKKAPVELTEGLADFMPEINLSPNALAKPVLPSKPPVVNKPVVPIKPKVPSISWPTNTNKKETNDADSSSQQHSSSKENSGKAKKKGDEKKSTKKAAKKSSKANKKSTKATKGKQRK